MNITQQLKQSWRMLSMVFALIAIWIIFQVATDGAFLQARNLSNLFRQMTVTGTLAIGMVLIIVAGHIDLSVGSVVCFLGVILAMLIQQGWSPESALAVTFFVGVVISSIQGWLTAYQRVPAFIVTLAGMMVFRGASMGVTQGVTIPLEDSWIKTFGSAYLTKDAGWGLAVLAIGILLFLKFQKYKSAKLNNTQSHTDSLGSAVLATSLISACIVGFTSTMNSYEGVPYPVLLMLVLMLIFHFISTQTVFGRHVFAVGGNVEAAHLSGVNVQKIVIWNFVLMGLLTTLGAMILTARVESAQPDAGQLLELDAIASCVIGGTSLMGGKGSIFGAILGALVMESLNNGMSLANMESFWQYIVKGLVLAVAVWLDVMSQSSGK